MADGNKATLRQHLQELRRRLLIIVGFFLLACSVGYLLRFQVTDLLVRPLNLAIYYNTPQGGFEFIVRIIVTLGFVLTIPCITYQLIRFSEPAINRQVEGKFMFRVLLLATLLMICGVAFGYAVILPITLKFFADFGTSQVKPLISANDYLNLVLGILGTFAFLFQLPLIIHTIDHIKPLAPKQLTRYRKHVIVGALALAVILPFTYDPMTQFVMAIPIILLFEISVLAVKFSHRARQRAARRSVATSEHAQIPTNLPGIEVLARAVQSRTRSVDSVQTRPAHTLDLRTFS